MERGTVVTFYSYKGGVGRTLALANIAALLSQWGYRVLCIDWDLEAPGLHLYFRPWASKWNHRGLTELIQAHADGRQPRWKAYTTQVQFPKSSQPLSLMTAGLQDKTYVQRMQKLNWAELYESHDLGGFLERLRERWKREFDFVLIDSRTGITDIGGICTVQLPDLLVLLFTANEQSLNGAVDVAERAKTTRQALPFDRAKLLALPVVTRFEIRIEYKLAQEWLKRFAAKLSPLYAEWSPRSVGASDLLNFTRVPYIPFWSFGEKLPVIEKGTKDPEDIGYALEVLAALVAQRFAYSDVLIRSRDKFVEGARAESSTAKKGRSRKGATRSGPAARLFISYAHQDQYLFDELVNHLRPLEHQGLIKSWTGNFVPAGADWESESNLHLEEADIILPLVSSNYLASDYVYEVEMARAVERSEKGEALVIPVLLKPTDWESSPLSTFQALPDNGKPVTTWPNRDAAWVRVAKGIRQAVQSLKRARK